jgi:Xaa-Pro dipeptidase
MINNELRSEFEDRLKRTRKKMAERNFDAVLVYSQKRAHVTYLSGYSPNYHTNAALVLLPLRRDPVLWIKFAFDLARAKATSWIEDVRVTPCEDACALVTECSKLVRQFRLDGGRIGIVASDLAVDEMSTSLEHHIRTEMPKVQFEAASDLLNSVRLTKSDTEIARLHQATQLAEKVVSALRKAIQPGKSDLSAVIAAEQVARKEGARCDIIISVDQGELAFPPKKANFHKRSLVTCEITVQLNGYWVQVCRTFSIGRPFQAQREVFAVSKRAYQAGLEAAQSGRTVAGLWQAIHESMSKDGCGDYGQYGVGHGVGLDLPELYPIERNCDAPLHPKIVLIVHPGIWIPNQGAAWTGGPIVIGNGQARPLDGPQEEIIEI